MYTPGLAAIIDLTSVPCGNVQKTGPGSYECQHGLEECRGNTLELCGIHHYNTTRKDNIPAWFDFLVCIEKNHIGAGEPCAKASGMNWTTLDTCWNGAEGKALFAAAYDKTEALQPPHQFTPWVTVNGTPQTKDPNHFAEAVCRAYTGPKPAACLDPPADDDDGPGLFVTSA
mmetsp:Transcript_12859/g.15273  ORF Transcript_12859/g.15273 Transcript_12859/m.15273 type:complete len:172 (+) Transcript_12859:64-579(+)|eukprot:CAMPEP_0185614538 /NCGR_PEP_ID=MMETSP0436-20130131/32142_1 /TAXON_ID=626734 ORGANISM="Favella taraikaensis, Strain Fe Narragansett Bay" /NCGR_SAMPLE_ID=MMETSP0436 /ASSEMBLY_ACC=CAM_ASM_000390 /LENGTH=171 /DNA_ID=CAMNT_0028249481 /DNA_START=33 /DNA_END=548 /DNA_ORIENTATION=-